MINKNYLLGVLVLSLVGCASVPSPEKITDEKERVGILLKFTEQREGTEGQRVDYFINKHFIRIVNTVTGDAVLLDRAKKTLYDIRPAEKGIRVIPPKPAVALGVKPVITEESEDSDLLGENAAKAWYISVDGKPCRTVVAVTEMIPEVVVALKEYAELRAAERSNSLATTPADKLDMCDVALSVIEPGRTLSHGFPSREWDEKGWQRFLDEILPDINGTIEFNQLPKGYKEIK